MKIFINGKEINVIFGCCMYICVRKVFSLSALITFSLTQTQGTMFLVVSAEPGIQGNVFRSHPEDGGRDCRGSSRRSAHFLHQNVLRSDANSRESQRSPEKATDIFI